MRIVGVVRCKPFRSDGSLSTGSVELAVWIIQLGFLAKTASIDTCVDSAVMSPKILRTPQSDNAWVMIWGLPTV